MQEKWIVKIQSAFERDGIRTSNEEAEAILHVFRRWARLGLRMERKMRIKKSL